MTGKGRAVRVSKVGRRRHSQSGGVVDSTEFRPSGVRGSGPAKSFRLSRERRVEGFSPVQIDPKRVRKASIKSMGWEMERELCWQWEMSYTERSIK